MKLESQSFAEGAAIPGQFAFAVPDPKTHVKLADNANPHLAWSGAPRQTQTFVVLCVDPDAPTRPDDVNQEGRSVPRTLPRAEFVHWVLVDIPANVTSIVAGACSRGVTPRGKQHPDGPPGSRQGVNDYTGWFAGDAAMAGTYLGYDGPCPPWNDELPHRYRFEVHATDLARCPVEGAFRIADVRKALAGRVLAQAQLTGRYTLNPAVNL